MVTLISHRSISLFVRQVYVMYLKMCIALYHFSSFGFVWCTDLLSLCISLLVLQAYVIQSAGKLVHLYSTRKVSCSLCVYTVMKIDHEYKSVSWLLSVNLKDDELIRSNIRQN